MLGASRVALKRPTAHATQPVPSALEYVPSAHDTHAERPVVLAKRPGAQASHDVTLDCPEKAPKRPVAQEMHELASASAYEPAPHSVQEVRPTVDATAPCEHARHDEFDDADGATLKRPTPQAMHVVRGVSEYDPAPHAVHVERPVELLTDPAAQKRHVASERAPVEALKRPVLQPVHDSASGAEYVPAPHGVHCSAPGEGAMRPGSHTVHASADGIPVVGPKRPAGHCVQVVLVVASLKRPLAHAVHVVRPDTAAIEPGAQERQPDTLPRAGVSLKRPAAQLMHAERSASEYLPASQFVHTVRPVEVVTVPASHGKQPVTLPSPTTFEKRPAAHARHDDARASE